MRRLIAQEYLDPGDNTGRVQGLEGMVERMVSEVIGEEGMRKAGGVVEGFVELVRVWVDGG